MKYFIIALLALMTTPVYAQGSAKTPYYVTGTLGANSISDTSIDGRTSLIFDEGGIISAAVGKHFTKNIRAEIELSGTDNDHKLSIKKRHGSKRFGGEYKTYTAMVNGYYDFLPDHQFSPFVGGGIGVSNHHATLIVYDLPLGADDTVMAYQVGGGVTYKMDEDWTSSVAYRYHTTEDPDFAGVQTEFKSQEVRLALSYNF